MDHHLKCDSSRHQIVLRAKPKAQKRNLIIFDIDYTILEAEKGWSGKLNAAKCPFCHVHRGQVDSELIFIGFIVDSEMYKYSLVLRRHFFELLLDTHANKAISADLVLYTKAYSGYARLVALGIDECLKRKYGNISDRDFVFKMVVSSTTPDTAKTVATLGHHLDLPKYENIIILDDNGRNVWCKYYMTQLKKHHNVNFILIQVPEFHAWQHANRRYRELLDSKRVQKPFVHYVTRKQNKDNLLYHFAVFLKALHRNKSISILFEYAKPVRDMSNFILKGSLAWWDWDKFEYEW